MAPLLDSGMPVLVYNGDKDYICNKNGAEAWTNGLVWAGQKTLQNAAYEPWQIDGKVVGQTKRSHNLTVVQVFEAGHMVPMDQPEVALALINQFIEHKTI